MPRLDFVLQDLINLLMLLDLAQAFELVAFYRYREEGPAAAFHCQSQLR